MSDALRAGDAPVAVDVEEGKAYFWCACGRSKSQPFCDGAHAGSGLSPVRFDASESTTLYFCTCKATVKQPFCDGSHKQALT